MQRGGEPTELADWVFIASDHTAGKINSKWH